MTDPTASVDPRSTDPAPDPDPLRPGWLAEQMVAALPELLEDVRQLLARDSPDDAALMQAEWGEVIQSSRVAMTQLEELTLRVLAGEELRVPDGGDLQILLFEEVGRAHWQQGRDISTLLAIYQSCARVVWRGLSRVVLGVDQRALAALAEALFFVVDQISSASARGYALEQAESGLARERLRAELVELLLSPRAGSAAVQAAAARAGWAVPAEAALVLLDIEDDLGDDHGRAALDRLGPSCLPVRRESLFGAIVPDPVAAGGRERLRARLAGTHAVIGPATPVDTLPATAALTQTAARLRRAGVLVDDPLFVDEHLDAIIVHRDPQMLRALRRQVLAPLRQVAPEARARLEPTLRSWLRHMGDRQAIARELHVHPQTVRYRMSQLHELYGATLDDPAGRQRLMLALGWPNPVGGEPAQRAGR